MKLADYINARHSDPFKWGKNDCIHFTIGWLEHRLSRSILCQYGSWHTEDEATAAIAKVGGLKREFDDKLCRIAPNLAHDGDIAMIERVTYLFSGAQLITVGKEGLRIRPRTEAKLAWTIP